VQHGAEVAALDLLHGVEQELGLGVELDLDRLLGLADRDHPEAQGLGAGGLVLGPEETLEDGLVGLGLRFGARDVGHPALTSFGTGRGRRCWPRPPSARARAAPWRRPAARLARLWPRPAPTAAARTAAGTAPRGRRSA